jgi:hypothetical protein
VIYFTSGSPNAFCPEKLADDIAESCIRPEVGSAGPKFITTDQRLLSAGMIAGADGWVGYVGQGNPGKQKASCHATSASKTIPF